MTEIELLLHALDQAFDRKGWHGANLKGSIRGLGAADAAWRPDPDRHCIAEQVLHAAYWKYTVRRRLRGDDRGSFPLKGSNWFALPDGFDEATWLAWRKILDEQHRLLREAVAAVPAADLTKCPGGGKVAYLDLIQGITAHDLYHTGQIQLLKRLRAES